MRAPKFFPLANLPVKTAFLPIRTGHSSAKVWRIPERSWILKTQPIGHGLFTETQKMQWLERQGISVPSVVEYTKDESHEYLLMTELGGQDASQSTTPRATVKALALGLQQWHSLPTTCPFLRSLEVVLPEAKQNWQNGLVDETDFDEERLGSSPEKLLCYLLEHRPSEHLVVTHGDFCLPNIMVQQNNISGFIDLGRMGLADAYQDLALFTRSLESEMNPHFAGLSGYFLEEYGVDANQDKLEYYRILDEFF